jgi:SAM-dependent methyltransferase
VFHHIDSSAHVELLAELRRTLRPGGWLFIFEHNPWNPLTLRAVEGCDFDANAQRIASRAMKKRLTAGGLAETRVQFRLFFPHALRYLRPLERALSWLPLGGQYCARARK